MAAPQATRKATPSKPVKLSGSGVLPTDMQATVQAITENWESWHKNTEGWIQWQPPAIRIPELDVHNGEFDAGEKDGWRTTGRFHLRKQLPGEGEGIVVEVEAKLISGEAFPDTEEVFSDDFELSYLDSIRTLARQIEAGR